MTLADGRTLSWAEIGADSGATTLVANHGSGSSRLEMAIFDAQLRELGVRVVAPERPGYGLSTASARGRTDGGRPLSRAVACSTFHHFADLNWDTDSGAPSFVSEPPGDEIKRDPSRLTIFKEYVHNIARWLGVS